MAGLTAEDLLYEVDLLNDDCTVLYYYSIILEIFEHALICGTNIVREIYTMYNLITRGNSLFLIFDNLYHKKSRSADLSSECDAMEYSQHRQQNTSW